MSFTFSSGSDGAPVAKRQMFDRTADLVARSRPYEDIVMQFITQYMVQLPKKVRLDLARNGAVRCHSPEHPVHYTCERLGNTFDPGNYVYEMTLLAMFPGIERFGYCRNTLGNICEGILYVGMNSSNRAAQSLARMIEAVAGGIYIICCRYDLYSLEELDDPYQAVIAQDSCNSQTSVEVVKRNFWNRRNRE